MVIGQITAALLKWYRVDLAGSAEYGPAALATESACVSRHCGGGAATLSTKGVRKDHQ